MHERRSLTTFEPGTIVAGRFRVERLVGRGGMGAVYAAIHVVTSRRVALKVIDAPGAPGHRRVKRFLREARAATATRHPNVVEVIDLFEHDTGSPVLVMELLQGESLADLRTRRGKLSLRETATLLLPVISALRVAHDRGIVHCDLKPDNIFLSVSAEGSVVPKVLDFGIATLIDPKQAAELAETTATESGVLLGTPYYMSFEQAMSEKNIDLRTDVWSVGVIFQELVTGRRPLEFENLGQMYRIFLTGTIPSIRKLAPELPEAVSEVIDRCLQKDRSARLDDLGVLFDALRPHADPQLGMPTPSPRSRRRGARRRAIIGVLMGMTALSVLCLLWWAHPVIRPFPAPRQPAPVAIDALGCEEATIEGQGASPELSQALGIGACARVASELGVDWNIAGAEHRLAVHLRFEGARARIRLSLADREVSAVADSPMAAMGDAVSQMKNQATGPAVSAAELARWAAKDAASARRIARQWARNQLYLYEDAGAEGRELVRESPESPWPYLMLADISALGSEARTEAIARGLPLVDKLSGPRADAARGFLMSLDPTASKDAAVGLLRQAYRAAGDDPEIGALYSLALVRTSPLAGHDDEGLAVLDRLYERYPRQSLRNLSWAIVAGDHDLDREGRLVDRMGAVLPEMRGRSDTVHFLVWSKRFDEARAAVDFARQLGRGTQASASMLWSKAEIELSAFRPLEARAPAFSVFADPNQDVSEYGARLYIASYFMSGQVIAGRSKLLEEVQRQSQFGNKWRMAGVRLMDLGHGRFLGDEVPGAAILEEVEQARTESASTRAYEAATARCEVALARMRAEPTGALKVGTSRLVELEHWAEEISGGDKIKRDGLLTSTLALTRAVRGVGAAARRWRETERAPFAVRRQMAFDAALALEATGDARGAIDAYRLAQDPYDIEWYGFVAAASEVRLAQLYRAQGRAREAEESEALVARVWVNADAGLVEAIRRLK